METQIQKKLKPDELQELSQKISQTSQLSTTNFVRSVEDQQKIANINPEDRSKAIGMIISNQAVLSGIKESVHDLIKTDVAVLLCTRLKHFSLEEIHYAFQIDRHGYHGDPTPHYQLFNAEYVTIVMNKYIKWKKEIRDRPNMFGSNNIASAMTEDDKRILAKSYVVNIFNRFKMYRDKFSNITKLKGALIYLDLIPGYSQISNEEKNRVRLLAIEKLKSKRYHAIPSRNSQEKAVALETGSTQQIAECWFIIVIEYFESLLKKDIHISELLSHIPDEE